jgi:Glutathione S-transferase, N-terminal domain
MIDLYYWPTPNGHKFTIFLEEAGLDYTIRPVNISAGHQFKPDFLAFSPNNRMPAIIDRNPADGGEAVTVFESGAILLYLAEKTAGQNHHFGVYAPEKIPYAIDRYVKETNRLYGVGDLPAAHSWQAMNTASLIWRPIRGSCRGSGSSRTSTTSSICAAGSTASTTARARGAPMRRASPSRPSRPSLRRVRSCFSDKRLQALSKPDPTTGLTGALAVLAARQWRDYRARGPGTCFADPGFTPPPACPPNPRQPIRRIGKPEDIARVALFLASDQSGWVTTERTRSPGDSGRKAAKAG